MLRILKLSLLVSVVLLLNAMTTLLFVQNAVPASAGPQCVSGDVNDDAAVDLGDPLYLLSYLFQGGPEPVACAQTPSGVTAAELDFITGKYNGVPDSISAFLPTSGGGLTLTYADIMAVPPGKMFVATSFHASPTSYVDLQFTKIWLGKNWDPTLGYPNGSQIPPGNVNDPAVMTALVVSGLVPGSQRMGDYESVSAGNSGGSSGSGFTSWHPRRDMQVVYRAGDVLSMVNVGYNDEVHIIINGYWLNSE